MFFVMMICFGFVLMFYDRQKFKLIVHGCVFLLLMNLMLCNW